MKFDKAYFDAGVNRIGTDCEKWDGAIAATGDAEMIPRWVADMDFPSAPAIAQALEGVLRWGTWGYTICGEADKKALSAFWKRRHHLDIDPAHVLMSPCVVTGLRVAVRALTQAGDGVLINPPVYGPFFFSVKGNERKAVESPLVRGEDGRYQIDFDDMERRLAAREAKAVMFCSPHNPVGRAWTKEELTRLVAVCRRYAAPLICDEIHADFVFEGEHHSILSIEGADEIAVMLCAASKTFNVAGLQQSSIVCRNPQMLEAIRNEMDGAGVKAGNAFALAATRAAYTDCDEWLDGLKAYLIGNRDFAMDYIAKNMPKVKTTPLDATYLMWLDCSGLGFEQQELLDRLAAVHVKVNDGMFFGDLGRGHIRLNIGCPRAQLEKALAQMAKVLI